MLEIAEILGTLAFALSGFFVGIFITTFLTALGGGVLRDILINRVPLLLKSDFYGSVAIVVAIMMYILYLADLTNFFMITLVFIFGVGLRLVAFYRDWHLPKI